jgi:hypothetical protein
MTEHAHAFVETDRDENANRVRIGARCSCGARRHSCFALRLSDEPDMAGNREWWGPVGRWTHSEDP